MESCYVSAGHSSKVPLLQRVSENLENSNSAESARNSYEVTPRGLIKFIAIALTVIVTHSVLATLSLLFKKGLADIVSTPLVLTHLKHLEAIAASDPRYGNSRSTTRGFNASAIYVADFLRNHTDYTVWFQPVVVKEQTDFSPPVLTIRAANSSKTFEPSIEVMTMVGSTSGNVTDANIIHISGCDESDLDRISSNTVVLLPEFATPGIPVNPSCSNLCARVVAVVNAGAQGVITYPSPYAIGYPRPLPPGRLRGCTEDQYAVVSKIPGVALGQKSGSQLLRWVFLFLRYTKPRFIKIFFFHVAGSWQNRTRQ